MRRERRTIRKRKQRRFAGVVTRVGIKKSFFLVGGKNVFFVLQQLRFVLNVGFMATPNLGCRLGLFFARYAQRQVR